MPEISVVTFKREIGKGNQIPVSTRYEHWGIYVNYDDENSSQFLYHADKQSLINSSTEFESKNWEKVNKNKIDYIVLVGYSSDRLTHQEMINRCNDITQGRIFNTLTNNCQEWVKSVLSELVNTGDLSNLALEELKNNNEITPLLGW